MANQRKVQKKQFVNLNQRKPQELSFVLSQLDSFAQVVGYGYSENNWNIAMKIYKSLEGHLLPTEREKLSEILRDSYAFRNETKTTSEISSLKARLSNG